MTGGVVTGIGVSQDAESLAAVERAARRTPDVADLLARDPVEEAFVLRTCHRVEAYVVTGDPEHGRAVLDDLGLAGGTPMDHDESLRHLLRVAAGLESMVLGEDQVLGQVRDAYQDAREAGGVGPVLEDAVTKAMRVGERARTETAINEGVVSLGSAAVRLAERHVDLDGETALVVGAGEMGTLAATALADAADSLVVANRTPERAEQVAQDLPCEAAGTGLDALDDHLRTARVAVTATASAEPVVDADAIRSAGETLVVDLGRPRDVAPAAAAVEGVRVFDYEDLEAVTERTHERRRAAAERVEAIVEEEFDRLREGFKRKRADEVIGAMYESADRLKRREVSTAMSKLESRGEFTDDQREVVESLADALVSQLLAAPTRSLREAAANDDWETISTALRLFDPSSGDRPAFDALPDGIDDSSGDADASPGGLDGPSGAPPGVGADAGSTASGPEQAPEPDVVVPEEYPDDPPDVSAAIDSDD